MQLRKWLAFLAKRGTWLTHVQPSAHQDPPGFFYGAPAGNAQQPPPCPGARLGGSSHRTSWDSCQLLSPLCPGPSGWLVHQAYLSVLGHLQISGSTIGCLALVCAACSVVLNCCWIMLGTEVFIPILIKAESMNLQERQSFFFSVSIIYSCIICTIVLSCIVSYFLLHYLWIVSHLFPIHVQCH